MTHFLEKSNQLILLVVRLVVGYMYILHGTSKFFEFPISMTDGNGSVPFFSIFGVAGLLEIIGGLLLILGLGTRFIALILSGQMAYGYFFFHATSDTILLPMINQGELAALYSVMFLMLVVTGAGKLSLDAKIVQRKRISAY